MICFPISELLSDVANLLNCRCWTNQIPAKGFPSTNNRFFITIHLSFCLIKLQFISFVGLAVMFLCFQCIFTILILANYRAQKTHCYLICNIYQPLKLYLILTFWKILLTICIQLILLTILYLLYNLLIPFCIFSIFQG